MSDQEIREILERILNKKIVNEIFYAMKSETKLANIIEETIRNDSESLRKILIAFSPMRVFMIRNTRKALEKIGYTFPTRDVDEEPVELSELEKNLLQQLDNYLVTHYGKYEKIISSKHRGSLGFIRSIYHQRFVSSFTAAYISIKHRKDFLEALLQKDDEVIINLAKKMFDEEEFEEDEEELINTMKEMVDSARPVVLEEIEVLKRLEGDLSQYSPDQQTSNDPKMQKIVDIVKKKIILFSKYTDTVDAVKRTLLKSGNLQKIEIGIYTGEGGMLYDEEKRQFKRVTKDDVSRALFDTELKVLVCSEAASEGLNLQAASVIVNVDMPWNPARVEQRIGRVDRLGQKEKTVYVRNVWYPDSIEARIYRKLFERKEIYQMVVGPAQQIISEALKNALDENAEGERLTRMIEKVLENVENAKNAAKKNEELNQGIVLEENTKQDDEEFIKRIIKFVKLSSEALGYSVEEDYDKKRIKIKSDNFPDELEKWNNPHTEPGKPNTLTFGHPIVIYLTDQIERKASNGKLQFSKSCYIVKEHDGLGDLIVVDKESKTASIADKKTILNILDELLEAV